MSRKYLLLFLALSLTHCGGSKDYGFAPLAVTTLHGTVSLVSPVNGARVCASSVALGVSYASGKVCTTSSSSGEWELTAGSFSGDVLVEADGAELVSPLSAMVTDIRPYERSGNISLSPITHLSAGYAALLVEQRVSPHEAILQSQGHVFGHFGGIDYTSTVSWNATASSDVEKPPTTDAVWSHIFTATFDELARRYSEDAGVQKDSVITLQTLVSQLYEDIRADGFFNGIGKSGVRLEAYGTALSGNTLRRDYGVAMARMVGSERNRTRLGLAEVTPLIQNMVTSQTPIFDTVGAAFNDEGPELLGCEVVPERALSSMLRYPQSGTIRLRCYWQTPSNIRHASLKFADPSHDRAIISQDLENKVLIVKINTEKLNPLGISINDFSLEACDSFEVCTLKDDSLSVDNRKVELEALKSTRWVGPGSKHKASGTVDQAIKKISLGFTGNIVSEQSFDFDSDTRSFEISYAIPCDTSFTANLTVETWAGTVLSEAIQVGCDQTPPILRMRTSQFIGDRGGVTLDLSNVSFPVVFQKDYTKFDYDPDQGWTATTNNLPVFSFSVEDTSISHVGVPADLLTVEYRYMMGDADNHLRDWERMDPEPDGRFRLPLSYQTLLPRSILAMSPKIAATQNFIATARPTDEHVVEIRITDPAGNVGLYRYPFYLDLFSPPVQMTDCRPAVTLLGGSLKPWNIGNVYSEGFHLFDSHLQFGDKRPEESLAPQTEVFVTGTSTDLETIVRAVGVSTNEVRSSFALRDRIIQARISADSKKNIGHEELPIMVPQCPGLRVAWEDAPCVRLTHKNTYPQHIVQELAEVSAAATIDTITNEETGVSQFLSDEWLPLQAGKRYVMHTTVREGAGLTFKGYLKDLGRTMSDVNHQDLGFLSHRIGIEKDDGVFGTGWEKVIEEKTLVYALEMLRKPPDIRVVKTTSGVPRPIGIEMDAQCRNFVKLRWDLAKRNPEILYE